MPIPVVGLRSGLRPPGRIPAQEPADDLLVELRVHGVGGQPPTEVLNDADPQQVAGDRIAGFYRTADFPGDETGPARHVEGYSWGGLNNLSSTRVLWLLLLPFMLGNLTGWMSSRRVREHAPAFWFHRAVSNVFCLVLTIDVVTLLCIQFADIVTYQGALVGADTDHWWTWPLRWSPVAGRPQRELLMAFALVAVLIGLLLLLAHRSRSRYESVRPAWRGSTPPVEDGKPAAARPGGLADAQFWLSQRAVARAANHHGAAAFAGLALIMASTQRLTAQTPNHGGAEVVWWIGVVLALAVLLAAVIAVGIADRSLPGVGGPLNGLGLLSPVLIGAVLWTGPDLKRTTTGLPGISLVVHTMIGAVVVLLVLLCLPPLIALIGGDHTPVRPPRRRLFAAPLLVALMAVGSLNTVGLAMALLMARATAGVTYVSGPGAPETPGVRYHSASVAISQDAGWAVVISVVGFLVGLLVLALVAAVTAFRQGELQDTAAYTAQFDQVRAQAPEPEKIWLTNAATQRTWLRQVARWQWIGEKPLGVAQLIWLTVLLPLIGVVAVLITQPAVQRSWFSPSGAGGKTSAVLVAVLPLALMALLRRGWRDPTTRRHLGILWDLGTFWPRSFHPLAPPCYAERAIPDLQRRLWWLTDTGAPVRLISHSQGTVLAAAALLPKAQSRPLQDRIHLVTFGSPLIKLYDWGFPGWFNTDVLRPLLPGGDSAVLGWQNFWYRTDPIAAPIFGSEPATEAGAQVDVLLADPLRSWYVYGQPTPPVGAHSGYWVDPAMWHLIDENSEPAIDLTADSQTVRR
jgi:hypothetical protein